MNNHETILRMIGEVDPKDEKALLDINARVWAFMNLNDDFKIHFDKEGRAYYRHNSWASEHQSILRHSFDMPKYTTSRDAIKSIRPDGWFTEVRIFTLKDLDDWGFRSHIYQYKKTDGKIFSLESPPLVTEELAELHATIQAIAYERQKGLDDEKLY
jgi:hypothetical protein